MQCSSCHRILPTHNPHVGARPENQEHSHCLTCPRCRERARQNYVRRRRHARERKPKVEVIVISSDSEDLVPLHRTQAMRF